MRGNVIAHKNTTSIKKGLMQDIFGTTLPPTTLPIEEMTDYDIIRSAFNDMCKAEGMHAEWKPGQDPPEKVRK